MKLALLPENGLVAPHYAADVAMLAERLGFESLWCLEQVILPSTTKLSYPYSGSEKLPIEDLPLPDPITWLSFAAGVTTKLKLGAGVLILPQRNPVLFAKELATLDQLSGGRVLLGMGMGWLRESGRSKEIAFEPPALRMDEYIEGMQRLWREPRASYAGKHVFFGDVRGHPRPVKAEIPILIGGNSVDAVARAHRLGYGLAPFGAPTSEIENLIRSSQVPTTCFGAPNLEIAKRYRELGVDRLIVRTDETDLETLERELKRFATALG